LFCFLDFKSFSLISLDLNPLYFFKTQKNNQTKI
jgi:hypothetical protein